MLNTVTLANIQKILVSALALLIGGCQVYVSADGSKHRQFLPAKDNIRATSLDTACFIRRPPWEVAYGILPTDVQGRRIIVPVTGADMKTLANDTTEHYLYFANPGCPATALDIRIMDSLAQAGKRVLVLSLRKNYATIDSLLKKTSFAGQPYYVPEHSRYGNVLLVNKSGS